MWLWVFVICVVGSAHAVSVGDSCITSANKTGECKRVSDCPNLLKNLDPISLLAVLHESAQKCPIEPVDIHNPGVCCERSGDAVWNNERNCGQVSAGNILDGTGTNIGELPWIVLLGYNMRGNETQFMCGGALINKRWVLAAAHCINDKLRKVRLGEHDLTADPDCEKVTEEEEYCFPSPVDVDVLRAIKHPGYVSKDNDIALVQLETSIEYYTGEIRPICLPTDEARRLPLEGLKMTVAGWGRTEKWNLQGSYVLTKVKLTVATHASCNAAYRNLTFGATTITNNQMCAGGEPPEDTCNGYGGGPLMMSTAIKGINRWTQFGVVSFGPRKCEIQGLPEVSTRVTEYLDWIATTTQE